MSDLTIEAKVRDDLGKGASRRLRRLADLVPAIIYGAGKEPQALTLVRKDLEKSLENEALYSSVLTINIDGKVEKAILKDLQRHPAREDVMHADFLRVEDKVLIKVNVPIHFINEETCHGVKMEGGMIQHQMTEIEIQCLPADIPEYIEVDMLELKTGDIVHLSDVKLPEGVVSVDLSLGEDHDLAIAIVLAAKGGSEDEGEDSPAAEAGADESSDD
ncbi:MAG: 50S ribosomal protein L25/general stress protein Ctc [Gammaproteobacteria bacterium]|nr:MAG: 50S ribosomal protein L25/general stress protein Ctc [Gammaproteobacteria bacterium]